MIYAGSDAAVIFTASDNNRFKSIQKQLNTLFSHIISNNNQNPLLVPRLFGGFSFDNSPRDNLMWSYFPSAYFVLPKYLYTSLENESWLTINLINHKNETNKAFNTRIVNEIEYLKKTLIVNSRKLTNREDILNDSGNISKNESLVTKKQWIDQVNYIVTNINEGKFKKAVLSRIYHFNRQKKIDIVNILSKLEKKFPSCYIFYFEPVMNHYFFGASPELLVNIKNSSIEVHALAGSYKRGKTKEEDNIFGNELLNNPKERAEHKIVIDQIRQKLTPFVNQLEITDTPMLLKLKNIQHLKTLISGKLINKSEILSLVEALHPTPAVGGVPQEIALKIIKDLELYPRGWYAAPVGWIDQNGDGTFAVAIRSAIVAEKDMWLYAGAGIVSGSIPEKEWQETQLKFSALLDVLESED